MEKVPEDHSAQRASFQSLCVKRVGLSAAVEQKAWEILQWMEKNGAEQEVSLRT